jgi:hypothetical protein
MLKEIRRNGFTFAIEIKFEARRVPNLTGKTEEMTEEIIRGKLQMPSGSDLAANSNCETLTKS